MKKDIHHLSFIIYHSQKGFTLIEILVAATIIGILSTIGITGFQAVTRNGRDAVRKSDLEQIRSALEIYKSENNQYPASSACTSPFPDTTYINPFPADPRKPKFQYCYVRSATSTLTYTICAHLENGDPNTDYKANCSDSGDVENNCGTSPSSATNCNYKVTNP